MVEYGRALPVSDVVVTRRREDAALFADGFAPLAHPGTGGGARGPDARRWTDFNAKGLNAGWPVYLSFSSSHSSPVFAIADVVLPHPFVRSLIHVHAVRC